MSRGTGWVRWAGAAIAAAILSGCSLAPQREPVETFDLGPPPAPAAANPGIRAVLLLPAVSAPAWLEGNGIVYRLAYENSARPQAYANSRWVASPAEMLTQRVRGRFAGAATGVVTGAEGARADYAVRLELEDFSQSFGSPAASRVSLRARASVVRLADRALVAQRVFSVEQAAPSPDARGAVAGLAGAADAFIEQLLAWTGEQARAPAR